MAFSSTVCGRCSSTRLLTTPLRKTVLLRSWSRSWRSSSCASRRPPCSRGCTWAAWRFPPPSCSHLAPPCLSSTPPATSSSTAPSARDSAGSSRTWFCVATPWTRITPWLEVVTAWWRTGGLATTASPLRTVTGKHKQLWLEPLHTSNTF